MYNITRFINRQLSATRMARLGLWRRAIRLYLVVQVKKNRLKHSIENNQLKNREN